MTERYPFYDERKGHWVLRPTSRGERVREAVTVAAVVVGSLLFVGLMISRLVLPLVR